MNDLVRSPGMGVMEMTEDELVAVLQNSIYPGAKLESIKMVLGYCKAAGLDPIQKPVHIVPMDVGTGKKGSDGWEIKEKRDVVMPGIGLYRTQAARNGQLAGIDEPEFGPAVMVGGIEVPEWCRVTVYRLIAGEPRAFTALEYWAENYATKNRQSDEPNAMWRKRPRGQLAKCAEAQALRKAFPEVGSQATAEEMEGKVIDVEAFDVTSPSQPTGFKVGKRPAIESTGTVIEQPLQQPEPVAQPAEQPRASSKSKASAPKQEAPAAAGGDEFASTGQQKYLQNKASALGVDLNAVLVELGGLVLDKLTQADFARVKSHLMKLEG